MLNISGLFGLTKRKNFYGPQIKASLILRLTSDLMIIITSAVPLKKQLDIRQKNTENYLIQICNLTLKLFSKTRLQHQEPAVDKMRHPHVPLLLLHRSHTLCLFAAVVRRALHSVLLEQLYHPLRVRA